MILIMPIMLLTSKIYLNRLLIMLNQQQLTNFIILTQIEAPKKDQPKLLITKDLLQAVLGVSATVNTELPLNRYSFFERLHDELLPNSRLEINLVLESDANLIWQAADDCRVIVTKMQLIVPRLLFNAEGQKLYMSKYLEPRKWTYWRENVETSNSTAKRTGNFRISTGITRPRHVFVFIINDANNGVQTENPFLYNTFSVANNRALNSCRLEVRNGNEYPEVYYRQSTEPTRVFRDFFKVCSWKLPYFHLYILISQNRNWI